MISRFARGFIRIVDAINYRLGRIAMYGIFVLMAVLLWSSISKTFFAPSQWTLEVAQFVMVGYFMLGGPYSIQLGANVRMDLIYGEWSDRKKAAVDAITVFMLMFYLAILLHGGLSSLAYSLGYFGKEAYLFFVQLLWAFLSGGPEGASDMLGFMERSPTAWRPHMWPIKSIMCIAIFLMLMQALSELFKDLLRLRGEPL